jgi:hypothetical protein
MAEHHDADAIGLSDLGAFLHRVVGVLVDDEHIALAHQTGQSAHVGQGDRRVNKDRFGAEPVCQLGLGYLVGTH